MISFVKNGWWSTPFGLAALVGLIYLLLLVPFLGMSSIGGSSEAREVHVASLVRSTGEWVLPLRNGVVPSKPILFHWVTAALGEVRGGVTPAVARATSLLFGCGTVMLTVLLGFALSRGLAGQTRSLVGALSAFVLATTYGFTQLALDARVDMTFSFFVVLALVALTLPFARETPRVGSCLVPLGGWDWFLFYGACGGAVLAKGPIGIVLPGLLGFVGLVSLVGFRAALGAFLRPRWGWLLFLALALPWYLLAAERGGGAFIERQLLFENLRRFTGTEHMNTQPPWFYLESMVRGTSPWWILFLFFMVKAPWRSRVAPYREAGRAGARLWTLGSIWFVCGVIFLSLASGKRHSYLLPLFPGLAVVVAYGVGARLESLSDEARSRWLRYGEIAMRWLGVAIALILAALAVFGSLDLSPWPVGVVMQRWIAQNRVALGIAAVTVGLLHLRWLSGGAASSRWSWAIAGLTCVWLLGFGVTLGYGVKSELKGFDRMAAIIRERSPVDMPLVLLKTRFNEYFDPFLLYLERPVRIAPPEAESVVCGNGESFLARRDWFDSFLAAHPDTVEEVVTTYQTYDEIVGRTDRGITLFRCRG